MSVKLQTDPVFKGLKLQGYQLVSDSREKVNLDTLMEILAGKDFEAYENYKQKYMNDIHKTLILILYLSWTKLMYAYMAEINMTIDNFASNGRSGF